MSGTTMSAPLQDIAESHQVAVDVHLRPLDRVPDPGLGRQVHNPVETVMPEQVRDGGTVRNVDPLEVELVVGLE